MTLALVLIRKDKQQVEVPVRHASEVIGRHTDCKIRIPDASVSRQHCEIASKDGKVVLRDLGSSNGTYVNRRRINQTELAPGDLLSIGKFVFVVRIDGKPAATEINSEDALEDGLVEPGQNGGAQAAAPAKPTTPPGRSSLLDDDDDVAELLGRAPARADGQGEPKPSAKPAPKPARADNDDSSEFDFDFLNDDEKDMPKL